MASVVKYCKCSHEFQDKKYGKNLRLFNLKDGEKKAKCTVCGNIISIN